jgi:hypothetical protein
MGEAGDAQRPVSRVNEPEKKGARSAEKTHLCKYIVLLLFFKFKLTVSIWRAND